MTSSPQLHEVLETIQDRWAKAQDPELDAQTLARLTQLEARRNLAVLELVLGDAGRAPTSLLWEIPAVLSTEALAAVLGQGAIASGGLVALRRLRPTGSEGDPAATDILTHLYIGITALRALASVRKRGPLKGVRIKTRLGEIRTDLNRIVAALSREAKKQ
jgi:hypothetical protein